MALKNKDGTTYKISCPNPLMMEQDFWDKFTKHNFEWTTEKTDLEEIEVIKKEVKLKEVKLKEVKVDLPKKDAKLDESPKDTPVEKPDTSAKESFVVKEPVLKKVSEYKTIQSYCLPAFIEEKIDDLYGEKYNKVKYLQPFTFDNIIIEKEDLYIRFWTNIDYEITKNSIIYPKNKEKRWWKVSEKEDAPQGKIYTAYISDYTPSFE
jgi:hypothetical protein